jgi:hypothetical protein
MANGVCEREPSRDENSSCVDYPEYYVAQAPDGLFLVCNAHDGTQIWERGDT